MILKLLYYKGLFIYYNYFIVHYLKHAIDGLITLKSEFNMYFIYPYTYKCTTKNVQYELFLIV